MTLANGANDVKDRSTLDSSGEGRHLQREARAEDLETSERLYRGLFESAVEGILVLLENRVVECNPASTEILGYSKQRLAGEEILRLLAESQPESGVLAAEWNARCAAAKRGERTPFEVSFARSDRRVVSVEVTLTQVQMGDDVLLIAVLRDLASRRYTEQLEAELRQRHKLESLGLLAGSVAHEINNPIAGIVNYAEIIRRRYAQDETAERFADGVIREANRVQRMVQGLLSYVRVESPIQHGVVLLEIVEDTMLLVRTLLRKDAVNLEVDVPLDLSSASCVPAHLAQVLINLITNARDAVLEVPVASQHRRTVFVRGRDIMADEARWVRLTVEDSGCGIAAGHLARVFEPFFTTKARGTGLGLAVSRSLVEAAGGRLTAESVPGQGTKVHIDLPVG